MKQADLKTIKSKYKVFSESISDNLQKAKRLLNVSELTFSYPEVDTIKDIYEQNYKAPEKLNLTYDELSEIFYTYIGEAFMHYNGGNWELSTVKADDAYGTPIVLNWGKDGFDHCRISPYVWKIRIERGKLREPISEKIKAAQIPMDSY